METVTRTASANRRRLAPQLRREEILDAARRCTVSAGDFDVSMREVAREAGVSRNLVYHYFQNQNALMKALLERESRRIEERIEDASAGAGGSVESAVAGVVDVCLDSMSDFSETLHRAETDEDVRERIAPHIERLRELTAVRLALASGLARTGCVHTAFLAGTDFMFRFVRDLGADIRRGRPAAVELCTNVCLASARRAAEIDRRTLDA